ncbi:C-type lectin domain family 10 member A-like [Cottoperca gobio]|uniref:C-type lectin domain family 10 member A-like n=1 Tax=Cottoperca gobio TaxID=56716 RepID=A0A6J2RCU9_COTGO|nr:C-type lectin domain family 10 member A-like [Cottoperca gobio]
MNLQPHTNTEHRCLLHRANSASSNCCFTVRRMETGLYVNVPADERRNRKEKRGSTVYRWVGVSFGLLCIVQCALNVSYRLHAAGCDSVTTHNFTLKLADDIRVLILERDQLVHERDQLVQERDRLVQEKDRLVQEKDRLVQERDRLVQEKHQLVQERDQLVQEMDQLVQERDQLVQERDQLVRVRDQLEKEKRELRANTRRLNDDMKTLEEKVIKLERKLVIAQQNGPRCPSGWDTHMSSCYQLSSSMNTWDCAESDCARKDSNLVILNDEAEEEAVRRFTGPVKIWMGVSGTYGYASSWTWTLVDGSSLSYANWNDHNQDFLSCSHSCAYVDQSWHWKTWFVGACQDQHYWMCEKKLLK